MATGYCTLEDVRRALRAADLPGDVSQDDQIAVDAIVPQTRWLEKHISRFFYAQSTDDIVTEATAVSIPQSPATRDDEYDIPSQGGEVLDASRPTGISPESRTVFSTGPGTSDIKQRIRLSSGTLDDETVPTYTRIRLDRKDAETLNTLNVINADGGYDDWVAESGYDGGVGLPNRGKDYWVRRNNGGVSELYLNVHSLDDEITSLSNAVYVDFDYGREGIPRTVRRATAMRAAADLAEEAVIDIPQGTTLYDIETKADELREQARDLLEAEGLMGDE